MIGSFVLLALSLAAQPVEDAKTSFEAGQQAYRAGDYLDAARAFEKAYELYPNAAITFSVAQSYRLHFFVDQDPKYLRLSIDAYKRYLREVETGGRRADAIEHLAALEDRLRKIEEEGGEKIVIQKEEKTPRIMVTASPEEATATLDGGAPSKLPLTRDVSLGEHEVVVSADGFFTKVVKIPMTEPELWIERVTLEPKPATVDIQAPAGANVRIDGRLVGVAPLGGPLALRAGKHSVVVSDLGHKPYKTEFEVARGDVREVEVDLDTTFQRTLSWWFLGAGAASFIGTGIVVGVALGSEARARFLIRLRDVDMMNLTIEEREDYIDARDRRNDLLAASSAGLAAGVLFSAVGGMLYFFDQPDLGDVGIGVRSEPVLSPMIGPRSFGLQGTF